MLTNVRAEFLFILQKNIENFKVQCHKSPRVLCFISLIIFFILFVGAFFKVEAISPVVAVVYSFLPPPSSMYEVINRTIYHPGDSITTRYFLSSQGTRSGSILSLLTTVLLYRRLLLACCQPHTMMCVTIRNKELGRAYNLAWFEETVAEIMLFLSSLPILVYRIWPYLFGDRQSYSLCLS